jgi:hypothetical protein
VVPGGDMQGGKQGAGGCCAAATAGTAEDAGELVYVSLVATQEWHDTHTHTRLAQYMVRINKHTLTYMHT